MGHHIDEQGRFKSDKYPWLPADLILISPRSEASKGAFLLWMTIMGHTALGFIEPRDEDVGFKAKLLVSFHDRACWPVLVTLAEDYASVDAELSNDIFARLKTVSAGDLRHIGRQLKDASGSDCEDGLASDGRCTRFECSVHRALRRVCA